MRDNQSPSAHLLFNLTYPFMKHDLSDDELNSITSNKLDMYRCAEITMNVLKQEFLNQGLKKPEHFDEVHQHIIEQILELTQLKHTS